MKESKTEKNDMLYLARHLARQLKASEKLEETESAQAADDTGEDDNLTAPAEQ